MQESSRILDGWLTESGCRARHGVWLSDSFLLCSSCCCWLVVGSPLLMGDCSSGEPSRGRCGGARYHHGRWRWRCDGRGTRCGGHFGIGIQVAAVADGTKLVTEEKEGQEYDDDESDDNFKTATLTRRVGGHGSSPIV